MSFDTPAQTIFYCSLPSYLQRLLQDIPPEQQRYADRVLELEATVGWLTSFNVFRRAFAKAAIQAGICLQISIDGQKVVSLNLRTEQNAA